MRHPIALMAVAVLAVGCSSSGPEDAAPAGCARSGALVHGITAPAGTASTATVDLPRDGPADPGVALVEVDGVGIVGVFRFAPERSGPLAPAGATVEVVGDTTGPDGIRSAASTTDGRVFASVMGRGIDPAVLMDLLRSGTSSSALDVSFDGRQRRRLAALDPSDVPGLGSVAVASRRHGQVTSLSNNGTRLSDGPQRAVVVATACMKPGEFGRTELLAWWYGVQERHSDRGHSWFSFPAPAGNGTTQVHLWRDGEETTTLATFGLTGREAAKVAGEVDREVAR